MRFSSQCFALLALCLLGGAILGFRRRALSRRGRPHRRADQCLAAAGQCGQCGYPGCKPYAGAIAGGDKINKCRRAAATIQALADLLDVEPEPLDAEGGEKTADGRLYPRSRMHRLHKVHQACPVDAIVGAARQMHTVIISECTGCDLCVEPCPVDCIDMIEVGSNLQSWKWNRRWRRPADRD